MGNLVGNLLILMCKNYKSIMANIKFTLNNRKKTVNDKEYSIYVRYRYGRNIDIRKSIKYQVYPKDWNEEKQEVRNRIHIKNREKINVRIRSIKTKLEDFESELLLNGKQPTQRSTERCFKTLFDNNATTKPNTLFEFIDAFKNRPDIKKSRSKGTLTNYTITQNILRRFNDEVNKIDFENIDMDFYNDFVEWCENQNLSLNYIGKLIQTLKVFMNNATQEKINKNLDFKNPRFKVTREETENVYLNLEELNKIFKLDLSKHPKLDQARDLFLIGAYTGLRVSDFNNLNKENIFESNGVQFLRVKTRKTQKNVVIPLRPEVRAIFKKHGNKPPDRMPDQQINYKIKEVCQNAGIDEVIHTKQTRGGKKIIKKNFKFDLVKTHTARRSFCTNAYLNGMNPIDIMQISGHTSEKTFLAYIKADALQKAVKISSHPFFKGANNHLKAVE